jgi:hypothetical protein
VTLNPRNLIEGQDAAADPSVWDGYEQWLAERAESEELADLRQWALATLPAEVMPCVCVDMTCLRCRVAAVVGGPEEAPTLAAEPEPPPPF